MACTDCGDTETNTAVNRYVLGTKPRLKAYPRDEDDIIFIPSEMRLSVKAPSGVITTYSGGDFTYVPSGYLFVYYEPDTVGWYQYEVWVKDGNGLQDAATKGFEIYDLVYSD